jgi:hypothetical protein
MSGSVPHAPSPAFSGRVFLSCSTGRLNELRSSVIALPKLSLRHEKRWHVQSGFAGYAAYGYYGSHSRYF